MKLLAIICAALTAPWAFADDDGFIAAYGRAALGKKPFAHAREAYAKDKEEATAEANRLRTLMKQEIERGLRKKPAPQKNLAKNAVPSVDTQTKAAPGRVLSTAPQGGTTGDVGKSEGAEAVSFAPPKDGIHGR